MLLDAGSCGSRQRPRRVCAQERSALPLRSVALPLVCRMGHDIFQKCMAAPLSQQIWDYYQHASGYDLGMRFGGRAVVEAALAQAWSSDCHHVLMQSGRADPRVHRFYERCGFKPGLRTAYVARGPQCL
jgi:hypothetical protein